MRHKLRRSRSARSTAKLEPGATRTLSVSLNATGQRAAAKQAHAGRDAHRQGNGARNADGDPADRQASRSAPRRRRRRSAAKTVEREHATRSRSLARSRSRRCGTLRRQRRGARAAQARPSLAADALHGLGHLLRAARRLPRDEDPAAGRPAQDDRPRGRRLPADLARRRLVAGPARRRGQHGRQPDAVAARDRLARQRRCTRTASSSASTPTPAAVGCGVKGGMYGHYQQDINTLAAWGVDAVKVDWCGGAAAGAQPVASSTPRSTRRSSTTRQPPADAAEHLQLPAARARARRARASTHSAFISYSFGPSDGNSWRTNTDVGVPGQRAVQRSVLRNMDADATQPTAAGPGHWNDPDYLAPDQGMGAEPVPDAVQHVGDARGAADDQRRHADDEQREPGRRSPTAG